MPDADNSGPFWWSVAYSFRNDPLVAYDLYNEMWPFRNNGPDSEQAWLCWRDGGSACNGSNPPVGFTTVGMQGLVNTVRGTGATQPIITSGTYYGSSLSGWLAHLPYDPLHQLAAGKHDYNDLVSCGTYSCWDTQSKAIVAAGYPVIATELGDYLTGCTASNSLNYMTWADQYNQSYLIQEYGPGGCSTQVGQVATLLDPSDTSYSGVLSGFGTNALAHFAGRP